jgi:hypothetical protein
VEDLRRETANNSDRMRRNNLVFFGIQCNPDQCFVAVEYLCRTNQNIELMPGDLQRCHHLFPPRANRLVVPVIANFADFLLRQRVYEAARGLERRSDHQVKENFCDRTRRARGLLFPLLTEERRKAGGNHRTQPKLVADKLICPGGVTFLYHSTREMIEKRVRGKRAELIPLPRPAGPARLGGQSAEAAGLQSQRSLPHGNSGTPPRASQDSAASGVAAGPTRPPPQPQQIVQHRPPPPVQPPMPARKPDAPSPAATPPTPSDQSITAESRKRLASRSPDIPVDLEEAGASQPQSGRGRRAPRSGSGQEAHPVTGKAVRYLQAAQKKKRSSSVGSRNVMQRFLRDRTAREDQPSDEDEFLEAALHDLNRRAVSKVTAEPPLAVGFSTSQAVADPGTSAAAAAAPAVLLPTAPPLVTGPPAPPVAVPGTVDTATVDPPALV